MGAEHESTTQKHIIRNIRRILLKTNLHGPPVSEGEEHMWEIIKMKLMNLTNHNYNFNMRFIY